MAGLIGNAKGPIEALRELHGDRPYQRRTMGTPDRTYALALLKAIELDAEEIGPGVCSSCGKSWPCVPCTTQAQQGVLPPIQEQRRAAAYPMPHRAPDPDYALPELGKIADFLANSWAAHDGWDTEKSIQGVEAATSVRQNPLVKDDAALGQ